MNRHLYILLFILMAQRANAFEERVVIWCESSTHSSQGIVEVSPGKLEFREKNLGYSSVEKEVKIPISIEMSKKTEKCEVIVKGSANSKDIGKFILTDEGDESPETRWFRENFFYILDDCTISKRYIKLLKSCQLLTKDTPGNKCYNESGKPFIIELDGATYSSSKDLDQNKIFLTPNGVSLKTYDKPKKIGKKFSLPLQLDLWKKGEKWCLITSSSLSSSFKQKCYTKLDLIKIRNSNGEITGTIVQEKDYLLIRQVKRPFSATAFSIDDTKPVLKITSKANITNVFTLNRSDGFILEGKANIQGNISLKHPRNLPSDSNSFKIADGNSAISDCNGIQILDLDRSKQTAIKRKSVQEQ